MSNELIEAQPQAPTIQLGTLQATTPQALVSGATGIANTLAKVIRDKHLYKNLGGRDHVLVEGWTLLGAFLGVIAREESVIALEDGGYEATVVLVRMSDGAVVSRASSRCGMDEPTWSKRQHYARRSMAITRATGKAGRLAFSWIMSLAGFDPTPLEEMPPEEKQHRVVSAEPKMAEFIASTVPAGKHKGKKWSELDDRQVHWYADDKNQCAESLKIGAKEEVIRREAAAEPRSVGPDRDDEPRPTRESLEDMQSDRPF